MIDKLRLLWLEPPVLYKGKDILVAWGEEMWRVDFERTENPEDADLIFFGSDSTLKPELIGKKATICFFWGWPPERFLNQEFREFAEKQLTLMDQCTNVLVPSPGTRDQTHQFGIPCQACLPGVDIRTLDQVPEQQREPRVVFISRLAPHKNLHLLIQALSLLEPQPPLTVIGPGDKKPYEDVASQLGVNIIFSEPQDYEKAVELKKAMILVHPSYYEGWGLPPLEALACGTPVIALDTPHMRWLLQDNAYYFSSMEGLAGTIKDIFNNPNEALMKAARGQQVIRNALTLEHAAWRLREIIHDTIKLFLGQKIKDGSMDFQSAYDLEHVRNWAYRLERFDPTWSRHWRAQSFINALRECNAKNILDVGCGAVYPTIFAMAGFFVTAVDISLEALKQVNKIAEKWGVLDKIITDPANAAELPYKDDTFDAVMEAELWEHVPDPQRVISEGMRVLKPGGYLISSTPIRGHHMDPMHLQEFDDQGIRELLKPWQNMIKKLEKIAEEGGEPSCYLIILQKGRDEIPKEPH